MARASGGGVVTFCSGCWWSGGRGHAGGGGGERQGSSGMWGTVGQHASSLPSSKAETIQNPSPAPGVDNGPLIFMSAHVTSVSQALLVNS